MSWQYIKFKSSFSFSYPRKMRRFDENQLWGFIMKRGRELFSFELINKLVRELSPIYRLNFYQLLLFFCQKIQLQLLLSFFCSTCIFCFVPLTPYLILHFTYMFSLTFYLTGDGGDVLDRVDVRDGGKRKPSPLPLQPII